MMIKSIQEIQNLISDSQKNLVGGRAKLDDLRRERAHLSIEGISSNVPKIDSLDKSIEKMQRYIDNCPVVLSELEHLLAAEQNRIEQEVKAELLEHHREIADECQVLSKNFISLLEKAVGVNQNLIAALSAEMGIRQKTGADVLKAFCHGSQQSLSMLLETCQSQMRGPHTDPMAAEILIDVAPIRV